MMTLLDTLNYFIQDQEGDLQGIEWEIRESTNYECGDWDWYCEQYDEVKQRLDDLKQIKIIMEAQS